MSDLHKSTKLYFFELHRLNTDVKKRQYRFLKTSKPPRNLEAFVNKFQSKVDITWIMQIARALCANFDEGKKALSEDKLIKELLTYGDNDYIWYGLNERFRFFKKVEKNCSTFGHESIENFIKDIRSNILIEIVKSFDKLKKDKW